jgi:hypothetical protein
MWVSLVFVFGHPYRQSYETTTESEKRCETNNTAVTPWKYHCHYAFVLLGYRIYAGLRSVDMSILWKNRWIVSNFCYVLVMLVFVIAFINTTSRSALG